MSRTPRTAAVAVALVAALAIGAPAAQAAFSAHGSARQVYATGLTPNARASLVNAKGHKLATRRASAEGGVLFRHVKPGSGYRVRYAGTSSEALTVLSNKSAPPSTDVYNQALRTRGCGSRTPRDGPRLALYVPPPQDVTNVLPTGNPIPQQQTGPTPTLIEYAGYGYADPAGPQSGIAIIAN